MADIKYFVISEDLRTIDVPKDWVAGVYNDKNVNIAYFLVNRYYNDEDLFYYSARVHYLNAAGDTDTYYTNLEIYNDEQLMFKWVLGSGCFVKEGILTFNCCLRRMDDESIVINEFNTTVATAKVLRGLENENPLTEEQKSDLISQFENAKKAAQDAATEAATYASNASASASEAAKSATAAAESAEKAEELIAEIKKDSFLGYEIVDALPETGSTYKIYLIPASKTGTNDIYDEYIWMGSAYEKLGSTQPDLSGYVKTGGDISTNTVSLGENSTTILNALLMLNDAIDRVAAKTVVATSSYDGLMSASDKNRLDTLTDTYINNLISTALEAYDNADATSY